VNHGIVVCDKPSGRSSHDVVAVARKAFNTRRVGHAGTLDPMASGALVLAIGEGLKILRYLTLDDKRYEARIALGSETDTLDAEGRVTATAPVPHDITLARARETARAFVGVIEQRPPAVSALKQDGVAMYKRVRRGEVVEPAARSVQVHELVVDAAGGGGIALRVHCGKGCYVRSLARDLALALGTCGHLAALRRTHSGRFAVEESVAFAALAAAAGGDEGARAALSAAVIPIEAALASAPRAELDAAGEAHAQHGRVVPLSCVTSGGAALHAGVEPVLLCGAGGAPIALGRVADDGLRVVRGLRA
jgi:tRNA pseudouridine55 synthase